MTSNTTRACSAALPRFVQALILGSALAATGLAHAEKATFTIIAGEDHPLFGVGFKDLSGSGSLNFSEDLIGALQTAAIVTTGIGPSVVTDNFTSLSVSAELQSLRGEVDSSAWTYTAQRVRMNGGASLAANTKNFATTGGSLSVTGITVDLTTKAIYANLTGGNGVGTVNNVHVWNYANIEGPITFDFVGYHTNHAQNTLSGLTITDSAFSIFAQSLGLRAGGINAMKAITDYGTMVATIDVTPVPEPSTYLLMGLGLVGVAAVARKHAQHRGRMQAT